MLTITLAILAFFYSADALGLSNSFTGILKPIGNQGVAKVYPDSSFLVAPRPGFSLKSQKQSFSEVVRSYVTQQIHPYLDVRVTETPNFNGLGKSSATVDFYFSGVNLCKTKLFAYQTKDNSLFFNGKIPLLYDLPYMGLDIEWIDFSSSYAVLAQDSSLIDIDLISKRKCWIAGKDSLVQAWSVTITSQGKPYVAIASIDRLESLEARYFGVEGSARVYAKNPEDGILKDFDLQNLLGGGILKNDYFDVVPDEGNRVVQPDHQFNFPPESPGFKEASLFAHANEAFDWFQDIGYRWLSDDDVITIVAGASGTGGDQNNATYLPGTEIYTPLILVGDGDGTVLRDLTLDSDVVSHELGHHVIFRRLVTVEGESVVIHEGLSDFFVFAKTGDSCLGESICPTGSNACMIPNQCLRSAESGIRYGQSPYSQLGPHLQGQVVSGTLWQAAGTSGLTEMAMLANKAIDYLPAEDASIKDLFLALLNADKDFFDGSHGCKIIEAAIENGYSPLLSDITCQSFSEVDFVDPYPASTSTSGETSRGSSESGETAVATEEVAGTTTAVTETPRNQSSSPGPCGVVGSPAGKKHNTLPLALLLLLPLCLSVIPRTFSKLP